MLKRELEELHNTIKESDMSRDNEQWYSNKELFEIFMDEVKKLTSKLTETNNKISKYNGLREELTETCEEVRQLKLIVKLMVWGYGIVGGAFLMAIATDIIEIL